MSTVNLQVISFTYSMHVIIARVTLTNNLIETEPVYIAMVYSLALSKGILVKKSQGNI